MATKLLCTHYNNPGNIRSVTGKPWIGEIENGKHHFCHFSKIEYGFRAMNRLLIHYITRLYLTTIFDIINRWAPPIENDTSSYISMVCDFMNFDKFDTVTEEHIPEIIAAITCVEQGFSTDHYEKILRDIKTYSANKQL
ncbi:hypothetical protein [Peromfec virus RodF8_22]|uniref:Uncharacterized protein n=1 Tax=Peromfec virus RodF8_22 TaxID=2929364 RepID=A0A976N2A4_9VIRU|nr:hypothetical protein [Peromfec virus RodF8_22]